MVTRLDTIGPAWTSSPIEKSNEGTWIGRVKTPDRGFKAYMVELVYDGGGKYPLKATTDIEIVPDQLPYQDEKMKPYLGKRPQR